MTIYILICCILLCGLSVEIMSSYIDTMDGDYFLKTDKQPAGDTQDKVDIKLYYESLCPGCRMFDTMSFVPVVKKLGQYLDIHTYPYGNAKTIDNNGQYEIKCQHGPEECYGNKLHACSIDILKNKTTALLFNACMMDRDIGGHGSDDAAATTCGKNMGIDSEPIKKCANSSRGTQLLYYYGEQSNKIGYHYVPYVLINGVEAVGDDFFKDVCAAFKNPPQECNEY